LNLAADRIPVGGFFMGEGPLAQVPGTMGEGPLAQVPGTRHKKRPPPMAEAFCF